MTITQTPSKIEHMSIPNLPYSEPDRKIFVYCLVTINFIVIFFIIFYVRKMMKKQKLLDKIARIERMRELQWLQEIIRDGTHENLVNLCLGELNRECLS